MSTSKACTVTRNLWLLWFILSSTNYHNILLSTSNILGFEADHKLKPYPTILTCTAVEQHLLFPITIWSDFICFK